jgi:hypothetical protein
MGIAPDFTTAPRPMVAMQQAELSTLSTGSLGGLPYYLPIKTGKIS